MEGTHIAPHERVPVTLRDHVVRVMLLRSAIVRCGALRAVLHEVVQEHARLVLLELS